MATLKELMQMLGFGIGDYTSLSEDGAERLNKAIDKSRKNLGMHVNSSRPMRDGDSVRLVHEPMTRVDRRSAHPYAYRAPATIEVTNRDWVARIRVDEVLSLFRFEVRRPGAQGHQGHTYESSRHRSGSGTI